MESSGSKGFEDEPMASLLSLSKVSTERTALLVNEKKSNKSIFQLLGAAPSERDLRQRKKEEQQRQALLRSRSVFAMEDGPTSRRTSSIKAKRTQERTASRTAQQQYKRDVEYDGENHVGVLFQLYGSVWPAVLPWCLSTLALTAAVWYLRAFQIVDLTIASNTGHSFMSILVSFLIVTRTTITYNRFMEARQHLADLHRSCREIVHYCCVLTNQNTNAAAKDWRQEVAYRTIVTLRVAVAALEYRSKGVNTWEVIPEEEHEKSERTAMSEDDPTTTAEDHDGHSPRLSNCSNFSCEYNQPSTDHFSLLKSLAHGPRTRTDENFRAPIVWAYNLREVILWPRKAGSTILSERPWHVNESLKLMALVSDFVAAYHELKKLVSTPFPFPLIQMTRTFLFFWVFTLPMVLSADNDRPYEVFVLMFFITYGFLGLEYVNMELDDPYGNDPNDFPGQRWSETVFEDIYIAIYKTDGYESAVALRSRISDRTARGAPLQLYREEVGNNAFR